MIFYNVNNLAKPTQTKWISEQQPYSTNNYPNKANIRITTLLNQYLPKQSEYQNNNLTQPIPTKTKRISEQQPYSTNTYPNKANIRTTTLLNQYLPTPSEYQNNNLTPPIPTKQSEYQNNNLTQLIPTQTKRISEQQPYSTNTYPNKVNIRTITLLN